MWAMPSNDAAVQGLYEALKPKLRQPKRIAEVADTVAETYTAVFIPGGHGAMIGLPESEALGRLLRGANAAALPTITLCHGT